jgi:hypothetical protein
MALTIAACCINRSPSSMGLLTAHSDSRTFDQSCAEAAFT